MIWAVEIVTREASVGRLKIARRFNAGSARIAGGPVPEGRLKHHA